MAKPRAFENWPKSALPVTYGPFRAVVDRWQDADTAVMVVDASFGEYPYVEIRLANASAPEKNTSAGKEAKAFVEELLPRDSRVILRTEKDRFAPTFSRWAAGILMEDGRDFATVLVDSGHGRWGSFVG